MKRTILINGALGLLLVLPVAAGAAESGGLQPMGIIAADAKGGMVSRPEGVGCSGKTIVVADTGNGRLLKYEYRDDGAYGGTELKFPQLPSPLRVQVTEGGDTVVLDGKLRKIARIKADGTFGGFVTPTGVPGAEPAIKAFRADAAGNLYLADIYGGRILMLDATGKFQKEFPFPKEAGFITDVALTPAGELLLADGANAVIYKRGKDAAQFVQLANLRDQASFPAFITVAQNGTLYVLDENGGAVIVVGADGSFIGRRLSLGWKKGLLAYPAQACANGAGNLFIADRDNSRVQIFQETR